MIQEIQVTDLLVPVPILVRLALLLAELDRRVVDAVWPASGRVQPRVERAAPQIELDDSALTRCCRIERRIDIPAVWRSNGQIAERALAGDVDRGDQAHVPGVDKCQPGRRSTQADNKDALVGGED